MARHQMGGRDAVSPRRLAVALAVFAVVTVDVLVGGPLSALDQVLSRWVRTTGVPGHGWNRPWHRELDQLVNFGDGTVVAVVAVIVLAVVCWQARTLLPLLRLAVLGGLTTVTVWGLKVAVARPAPSGVGVEDALRSYPSGHTATAVVLWGLIAAVVAEYRPRSVSAPVAEVLSWLGPLLTMTGLLLRDYHWLSDLIAGAAVGVVLVQAERLALARCRGGRRGSRRGAGAVRPSHPAGSGDPPPVVRPPAPPDPAAEADGGPDRPSRTLPPASRPRSGWTGRLDPPAPVPPPGPLPARPGPRRWLARVALTPLLAALPTCLLLTLPPPGRATAEHTPAGTLCTIRDSRITESSGLAVAGDSLYTVNDGGSRLRVFVLDRSCRVRRTVEAPLDPYDVEDLARTPDGTLWLADVGDNERIRSTVALERLRPDGTVTLFRLTYPDGPHDAEALLLDRSGRPYVVTKEPLSSGVYTPDGPLSTRRPTALRKVRTLSFGPTGTAGGPVGTASQVLVTGGAVSADGRLLVLRTYTDAYVWPAPDGDLEAALRSAPPSRVPLPATRQGEAIAVTPDARSLLTSTEGLPAPVHQVPLGDLAAAGTPPADAGGSAGPPATTGQPARPGRVSSTAGPVLGGIALAGLLLWLVGRARRPASRR